MNEQRNLTRIIASILILGLLLPTGSIPTSFVLGTAAAATTTQSYVLSFQGYDYNNQGEVSVLVNNQVVSTLPASYSSQNAKTYVSFSLDITKYVVSGSNSVTFRQNMYSSGVQSVKVTGPSGVLLSDSTYHDLWIGGTASVSYKFNVQASTAYAVDIVNGQLVDASGKKFMMVGINYGDHPEGIKTFSYTNGIRWRNYAADADAIKNYGFNTVKLVKEWGSLENSGSRSVFTYNNYALQQMMQQIANLTQRGINVVVKLHADADTPGNDANLRNFLGSQYCASSYESYESFFTTNFYTTSYLADGTSGAAHLKNLWLKISQLTRSNSRVIGFDLMNEPTYCYYTSSTVSTTIHDGWHQRVAETVQALRNDGDNRIIFAEEAPMFESYTRFTPWSDPKIVSSIHWYQGVLLSEGGQAQALTGDINVLRGLWSNIPASLAAKGSPQYILQAEQKYPNQLFEVGEFGNMWGNSPGDIDDQWTKNSIAIFQENNVVGVIYWPGATTGTWIQDLASIPPP